VDSREELSLRTKKESPESNDDTMRGRYLAYMADGKVIWNQPDYQHGRDSVPHGASMVMRAGQIISKDNLILHRWDPWGYLRDGKIKSPKGAKLKTKVKEADET